MIYNRMLIAIVKPASFYLKIEKVIKPYSLKNK